MAIGFGPGADMHKNNASQRKALKGSKARKKHDSDSSSYEDRKLVFKKSTPEDIAKVKAKLNKRKLNQGIAFGIVLAILLLLGFIIFY